MRELCEEFEPEPGRKKNISQNTHTNTQSHTDTHIQRHTHRHSHTHIRTHTDTPTHNICCWEHKCEKYDEDDEALCFFLFVQLCSTHTCCCVKLFPVSLAPPPHSSTVCSTDCKEKMDRTDIILLGSPTVTASDQSHFSDVIALNPWQNPPIHPPIHPSSIHPPTSC